MTLLRLSIAAILMALALFSASQLLGSPYQLWLVMAGVGLITGIAFTAGQRHVITGFGLGITLMLIFEVITYGSHVAQLTAPVYAAGYLFAVATTLALRYLILFFRQRQTTA